MKCDDGFRFLRQEAKQLQLNSHQSMTSPYANLETLQQRAFNGKREFGIRKGCY
jgi:hypothetical protein